MSMDQRPLTRMAHGRCIVAGHKNSNSRCCRHCIRSHCIAPSRTSMATFVVVAVAVAVAVAAVGARSIGCSAVVVVAGADDTILNRQLKA